jgi:hypothetical protein
MPLLESNNAAEIALKKTSTELVNLNGQIDKARGDAATDEKKKDDLEKLIKDRTKLVKELVKEESNSRARIFHSTTKTNKWGILGFGGKKGKGNKTKRRR